MLDYAWIIPAIPALSFVLILFFGKKMPRHGSEIGITAIAASFVLSCIAAVQWIQHVNDAEGKSAGGVLQAFGKGFLAHGGDHEAVVKPVINTVTWW
jgi:NADH:ubiquinone oxidoreductase subunit 5 (subunit L)/multisubunit Na+/H+ antiporter MnhA subunit